MENNEKNAPLRDLMETTMVKIREMVDTNAIIGEPITTPDGVTVIPISRVSFGFGTGGSDYGKTVDKFGGAGAAGARIDPVSFLHQGRGHPRHAGGSAGDRADGPHPRHGAGGHGPRRSFHRAEKRRKRHVLTREKRAY